MKLGRKPARHSRRSMRSALVLARHLDALGTPPVASNDYVTAVAVPWGMYLNDQIGDCVCADTAHALMLRTANTGTIVVPQDSDVEKLYEVVGGYVPGKPDTDQGCNESDMCNFLQSTGFLGHKSAATGSIEPSDLDHVRWSVQLFGTCRLGVNVPQSAMDQTNAGQPWTISGNSTILGGHDVPVVDYDGEFFYVVTWGKLQDVTPEWMLKYTEEAHAEVFPDWIKSQGMAPSGFDLHTLLTDLQAIDG